MKTPRDLTWSLLRLSSCVRPTVSFIISDSFLRPAALSLLAGFVLLALLLDALLVVRLVCVFEFDAIRMLRADVSLAISESISFMILAVSEPRTAAVSSNGIVTAGFPWPEMPPM